nr:MAG TPA: hypothetical protein [Caudoviricetes sp.]
MAVVILMDLYKGVIKGKSINRIHKSLRVY